MLHHEEQPAPPSLPPATEAEPAAQVRVTAEEFARAVTRFQARREQAAQRMEGTVAIGDAVHELGLEATPEEILAEVQAERAAQAQSAAPVVRRLPSQRRPRFLAAGVLVAGALGVLGLRTITVGTVRPMTTIPAVQTPAPSSSVSVTAAPTMLVQDTTGGKSVLRILAEVPDNTPVHCDLEITSSQARFANYSAPSGYTTWTLIKHDGVVYVRGWIAAMSPQAVRSSAVSLYSRKDLVPSGFSPTPATVRLDDLHLSQELSTDDTIVVQYVQPDAHFYER